MQFLYIFTLCQFCIIKTETFIIKLKKALTHHRYVSVNFLSDISHSWGVCESGDFSVFFSFREKTKHRHLLSAFQTGFSLIKRLSYLQLRTPPGAPHQLIRPGIKWTVQVSPSTTPSYSDLISLTWSGDEKTSRHNHNLEFSITAAVHIT